MSLLTYNDNIICDGQFALNGPDAPPLPEIVTWADGTDAQLKAMLDAHYAGLLDIHDYWSVGDTRTVYLSAMEAGYNLSAQAAQDVEFVLMDAECTGIVAADGSGLAFIIGMKDSLSGREVINTPAKSDGGYCSSNARAWIDDKFVSSVPSGFISLTKLYKMSYGTGPNDSTPLIEGTFRFSLPPEKAFVGDSAYISKTQERALYSQWDWYKTAENRIKKLSGTAFHYWVGSASAALDTRFVVGLTDGNYSQNPSNVSSGLSMFGCI